MERLGIERLELIGEGKETAHTIIEGAEALVPHFEGADAVLGQIERAEVVVGALQGVAVDRRGGRVVEVLGVEEVLDADGAGGRRAVVAGEGGLVPGDRGVLPGDLDIAVEGRKGVSLGRRVVGRGPDPGNGECGASTDQAGAAPNVAEESIHGSGAIEGEVA